MTENTPGSTAEGSETTSSWQEALRLASVVPGWKFAAPLMIALGLGAAFADTVGVGLAVVLLFALLGQTDRIAEGGGFLARIHSALTEIFGTDPQLIAAAFFGMILFNALLVYAYQVVTATMMNHVAQRMRDLVHRQYVTVGYRYLQAREHGDLIHTLATETWTVADAFYHLSRIGVNLCALLVFGVGLFILSWIVGLTALAGAILVFVTLRLLSRPVRRLGQQTLAANKILAERMLVSLHGIRTIRVFAQEDYVLRVFGAASSQVRRLAIRTERIKALIGPMGEIGSLGTLLLIAVVASMSKVDVPTTITAVLLLFRLQPHLREIETSRLSLAGMNASLKAVRATLDDDKPRAIEGSETFPGLEQDLRFENVTFTHDPRRRPSIDAVSFVIPRGQTTAISGPSGSGKTTILNLILRLYDPDTGTISVDGVELHRYSRASWLDRLAIAGQDVELIEGTVAQNIRLGARDADMDDVRRICALVEIADDIKALPDGFDTHIGSAGLNFSGGQRQRMGLARALLRAPDLLILDEAMSAIEPEREERIRRRIAEIMQGKTVIVVSHRSNKQTNADAIICIDQGRVVPSGPQAGSVARQMSANVIDVHDR